jgi:hypothetical protein
VQPTAKFRQQHSSWLAHLGFFHIPSLFFSLIYVSWVAHAFANIAIRSHPQEVSASSFASSARLFASRGAAIVSTRVSTRAQE